MRAFLAGCCILAVALSAGAADAPAVTIADDGDHVVLDNGVVSLTLTKRGGRGTSIHYKHDDKDMTLAEGKSVLYFDAGGGKAYPVQDADAEVVRKSPDIAEVMWAGKASGAFPFDTEMHCVLRRGESGFYLYAVYRHGPDMAAGGIGETRFVLKGVPGTDLFTHHVVDDRRKGPYPTSKVMSQVQDATWLLEDGTYYTKYDNSAFLADHRVHGMAGHGVGVWMTYPSAEFVGGGPFKQELTVHKENTLLGMLVGGHFGSGGLRFGDGEPWDKVYGPLFVYVNSGESVDAMWDDAKKRADAEAAQWPYGWLEKREYPLTRGNVAGALRLADGGSAKDAWIILSPPDEDWTQVLKGYDFWTRADADGRFKLTKVRPGSYTLRAVGADQFEEFRREDVRVEAGKDTDLGELKWEPIKHGRRLWQIGVADRSSAEFKGGDDCRHYDNFARYARAFPDDVTFVIGKSKEAEDWGFAQWSTYSKKPYWTIRFDLPQAGKRKATLTIGFTSANPPKGRTTNLQVKVNGKEVEVVHLPKTGTAGYRSGGSDSPYHVAYISFDAGLLGKGENEITLGHAEAEPLERHKGGVPGEVMYDALRLEVDPDAAPE
jgi:rhamnogalacturonan endolyase